jgi:carboxypeptidase Taq
VTRLQVSSSPVSESFARLRAVVGEISDIHGAINLLSWDEETHMPRGGGEARAEQKATLERLAHERLRSDELARLLDELEPLEAELDRDSDEASLVRVTRREHEKARRVPTELRAEIVRNGSLGYAAWLEARARNDFRALLPHLVRSLELRYRYIDCFDAPADPYDVLLDDYEPGTTTSEIDPMLTRLREALVPMVAALPDADEDAQLLRGSFPLEAQQAFSLWLLERCGFDQDSWSLTGTVHPFEISISPTDVRLTTRYSEGHLGGIFACLHEFGHGLYERQVSPSLARTPLADGASAALHESQSRLWENLVGRGLPFWEFAYPQLQAHLPQLADVSLARFHRAVNAMRPSLIRVEADELTYSLHIVLRYELERDLVNGRLAIADLEDAFSAKMRDYLDVEPPDAVRGVLQDSHWADLSFGYFPSYAIGNVISVQLWELACGELDELEAHVARGEFAPLREWLRERLHRHGRKYTAAEMSERALGGPLDPEPYLAYLSQKLDGLVAAAA